MSTRTLVLPTFALALLAAWAASSSRVLLSSENSIWSSYLPTSSVQSLSRVWLFATPWPAALQASLSITNSQSLLKLMSIESMMPSNHLILCRSLLLPPSIFPSISVFSNELVLCIRWPKYWSFSISPSSEYSGLISFRKLNWLVCFLCSPGNSQEFSPTPQFKGINSLALSLLYGPTLMPLHDYWKKT